MVPIRTGIEQMTPSNVQKIKKSANAPIHLEPSIPVSHATELTKILHEEKSADGVNLDKNILLLFTDGGPDHQVTNDTVKLSLATLFMNLDLDCLIALRTAPHIS